MNLDDIQKYLLPIERGDWDQLLASWGELIPAGSCRWLLSRFGELFLEQSDGEIGMLQITGFRYEVVAENKQDFMEWLDDPDKMVDWFLAPLVDRLVSKGRCLLPGQCYSFVTQLGLGGQITEDNVIIVPIEKHFANSGQIFQQIKDVPYGMHIRLVVEEKEG